LNKADLHYILPVLMIILASLACDLPVGVATQSENLGATETMQALATVVAGTLEPNMESGGSEDSKDESVEGADTESPQVSETPTITVTPTLGGPMVHVSMDTNCRFGPGDVYEYQGALLVGEEAAVTGKLADESFWYIENPDAPPPHCWIWGMYASVEGDKSGIPILTPPPTPTATATTPPPIVFTTYYYGETVCMMISASTFYVRNDSNLPFESAHMKIVNVDNNDTWERDWSSFNDHHTCGFPVDPLNPGEFAYLGWSAAIKPGINHKVTLTVCSGDNLGGDCGSSTFYVP
jgi:hypothetical protein